MPKYYRVTLQCQISETWEVEAKNIDEAMDKALNNDGKLVNESEGDWEVPGNLNEAVWEIK